MIHAELIEAIDRLPSTRWSGSAWRHVAAGRPAMSGEGARIAGGRWNPSGSFATLYLGLDVSTVIAEFYRLAAKQHLDPYSFLPRQLFRYEAELSSLVDLRQQAAMEVLGLNSEDLASSDARACQAVGEAAFVAGREGVIAPSATGSGQVLAVYLERLSAGSTVRDVDSELWERVPPLRS